MWMSFKRIFLERRLQRHIAKLICLELIKNDTQGVFHLDPCVADYVLKNVKPEDIEPLLCSLKDLVEKHRMQEKLVEYRRDLVRSQLSDINKI